MTTPTPTIDSQDDPLSKFRTARIAAVRTNEFFDVVKSGRAFFVHVLAVEAIEVSAALARSAERLRTAVSPIRASSWDYRFNVDGYLVHGRSWSQEGISAYVQWLRRGGVEIFAGELVTEADEQRNIPAPILAAAQLAQYFYTELPKVVGALRDLLGVTGSLAMAGSLTGMRGVRFSSIDWRFESGPGIDRDLVLTPWSIVAQGADPIPAIRAVGDILWESAGHAMMPDVSAR